MNIHDNEALILPAILLTVLGLPFIVMAVVTTSEDKQETVETATYRSNLNRRIYTECMSEISPIFRHVRDWDYAIVRCKSLAEDQSKDAYPPSTLSGFVPDETMFVLEIPSEHSSNQEVEQED